jgi:hypothetical protein
MNTNGEADKESSTILYNRLDDLVTGAQFLSGGKTIYSSEQSAALL